MNDAGLLLNPEMLDQVYSTKFTDQALWYKICNKQKLHNCCWCKLSQQNAFVWPTWKHLVGQWRDYFWVHSIENFGVLFKFNDLQSSDFSSTEFCSVFICSIMYIYFPLYKNWLHQPCCFFMCLTQIINIKINYICIV